MGGGGGGGGGREAERRKPVTTLGLFQQAQRCGKKYRTLKGNKRKKKSTEHSIFGGLNNKNRPNWNNSKIK